VARDGRVLDNRLSRGHPFCSRLRPAQPNGRALARPARHIHTAEPDTSTVMNADMLGEAGDSQPHDNIQPYLAVNFCIALNGIYPSRS
jgi:microcystin-dependent protein